MPTSPKAPSVLWTAILLLTLLGVSSGCGVNHSEVDYVARVGNRVLTQDELHASMQLLHVGLDSIEARQQIIGEWVTNELMAQEAVRRGLRSDPEVQRLLEENERSVLISALMNDFLAIESIAPTRGDIEAYFAQHQERLLLREDYIRVRYLSTQRGDEAARVRDQLRDATVAGSADSAWTALVSRYAADAEASTRIAANYYPQSRIFPIQSLHDVLTQLERNQIVVLEERGTFHLVQLVDRRPAGSLPEIDWVRDEIMERIIIEHRKQMIARQVQRLRTEAQARENLEIK